MSSELDDILDELDDELIDDLQDSTEQDAPKLTDDNLNDYILQKMGMLIEQGVDTINIIQQNIRTGVDADELDSFSKLITSVTKAADTLNKINIQNKKTKATKELKQIETF